MRTENLMSLHSACRRPNNSLEKYLLWKSGMNLLFTKMYRSFHARNTLFIRMKRDCYVTQLDSN